MKKTHWIWLALATIVLAACSATHTPKQMEQTMLDLMVDKKYDKAMHYMMEHTGDPKEVKSEAQKAETLEFYNAIAEKVQQSTEERGGLASYHIDEEWISEDGTAAMVYCTLTYEDGSTESSNTKYKKIGGEWRIDGGK